MKRNRLYWPILLLVVIFIFGCKTPPQAIEEVGPYSPETPQSENEVLESSGLTRGRTGYILYDPNTRRTLTQVNSQKLFLPGSTLKILSVAAGLKVLGPDFRFKTTLSTAGKVVGDKIEGDLYLTGGGDPFLNLANLMGMVQSLKSLGVKKLTGRFFYDDSLFPEQKRIDLKRDSQASFNPGVSALSSEFNRTSLRWKPHPLSGKAIQAYTIPPTSGLEFRTSVKSDSNTDWFTENTSERSVWSIPAKANHEGSQNLPLSNPGISTAQLFQYLARMEGLDLPSPLQKSAPAHSKILVTHLSETLLSLSERILEFSNNLMAELVLVATANRLGHKKELEPGLVLANSAERVSEYLKKQIPETSWEGFKWKTGSGLGGENQITPAQLLGVLEWAEKLHLGGPRFSSLLPISGWKGISKRLAEPTAALQVWAKTGTLHFAHGIAGVLYPRSGKKLLFVILNADAKQREQAEAFDSVLPPALEQSSKTFIKRTDQYQDRLLTRWIQDY
ncbi:MAG: D-alanyl-D-alanine carboxypeptidase/D-alanyl-D-alanine-endopeptidase [Bdellovibrio sp.]|nr:D-alanyl-D-alanine carboxypeptidase/D-alanyl-D-alanine-endopeptidase [Bdellovibrio sp.]